VICYLSGLPFFFLFLFIPFLSLNRSRMRRCPACGFESREPVRFCPYDGNELE
jgi:hypothetical protein